MKFLEMTGNEVVKNYQWERGCSEIHHHWEMSVLDGNAVLHVAGLDGQYWGHIQLESSYDPDLPCLYSTRANGLNFFSTPEDCAKQLENKWRKITFSESKITFSNQF